MFEIDLNLFEILFNPCLYLLLRTNVKYLFLLSLLFVQYMNLKIN